MNGGPGNEKKKENKKRSQNKGAKKTGKKFLKRGIFFIFFFDFKGAPLKKMKKRGFGLFFFISWVVFGAFCFFSLKIKKNP